MKTARYSDAQIMGILKQAEGGVPVSELCREHGMSSASFYKWRAKFGGMDASLIAEMKDMAEQNRRLKKMYAEMSMQNDLLKEALGIDISQVDLGWGGSDRFCRCFQVRRPARLLWWRLRGPCRRTREDFRRFWPI